MPAWWVVTLGVLAVVLALAYAYSRLHLARARRRRPATGEFVEVDGVRVHYVRKGQGPPVVCLHGLAGFLQDFTHTPIVDRLSERFDVVALDRPGYGHSTRPDPDLSDVREQADWLVRLFDELGIEAPIVVGHSLGGGLAMALAVRHPERVRGLVLLAPYVYPNTEPDDWIHALPRLPLIRSTIGHLFVAPVTRLLEPWFVSASFSPQPIPDDYHELWLDLVTQPDHFDSTIEEVRAIDPALADLRTRYPTVEVPTVVITGSDDRSVVPGLNARRLVDELPDAELEFLEGYGHMVPWTHPGLVIDAVDAVHDWTDDPAEGQDRSEA